MTQKKHVQARLLGGLLKCTCFLSGHNCLPSRLLNSEPLLLDLSLRNNICVFSPSELFRSARATFALREKLEKFPSYLGGPASRNIVVVLDIKIVKYFVPEKINVVRSSCQLGKAPALACCRFFFVFYHAFTRLQINFL